MQKLKNYIFELFHFGVKSIVECTTCVSFLTHAWETHKPYHNSQKDALNVANLHIGDEVVTLGSQMRPWKFDL